MLRTSIQAALSPANGLTAAGHRAFRVSPTRPLQRLFDWRSEREKKADESCEKTREAAENLKEGSKQIKETTEYVRDVTTSTSKTVTGMANEVKKKVTGATDEIKEKLKEPIQVAANEVVGKVEDTVVDKIKGKALGGGKGN